MSLAERNKGRRTLRASDLTSKFGFWDGGILGPLVIDWYAEAPPMHVPNDVDSHDVLAQLVRTHLLPLLPGVEVYEIGTAHNPIRTDQELTDAQEDVQVEITQADVDAAVEAVRAR